jgi:hypothetical protein
MTELVLLKITVDRAVRIDLHVYHGVCAALDRPSLRARAAVSIINNAADSFIESVRIAFGRCVIAACNAKSSLFTVLLYDAAEGPYTFDRYS